MSLPKTYKAVVLEKAGAPWTVKEVELKLPGPGEILVEVEACGVCHSDLTAQQTGFGGLVNFPLVPGHELIGKVVAVGDGEKVWKVGDRVGGPWHGGQDGTCKSCKRGMFQTCSNLAINGITRDGGYAEYCLLRSEATVPIPTDINAVDYAPQLCAGVTVFNSIRNMKIVPGDVVAIQGLGGLGHLALQYARKLGYRTVAMSTSDAKKDFALKLGANEYIDTSKQDAAETLQKMGGASLIVVTAPNPKLMTPLISGCAPLGKLLLLAPVGEVPFDTVQLVMKGISVHGWPSGHSLDSEEAIEFAKNQDVNCMVESFPLDKVEQAVERMSSGKARFRCVLTMR